ncbi:FISUMP domain-containing protein [Chryseobacterium sp. BIGb0232]|uniref:FISUMP domain-containing protein n=1 Tax=Chryseobacterium sp. BIGb0232 TaxID=2940598 RepID=UPI000F4A42AF|nr:FISUMP domain-containing protein [Chryseobacterium sp. BIGb0232]MCS4304381.1 hypothetical protein [Chryseobacterium sp. BIGb0232]ROS14266.1 putative repeat protein [Chryseobacterium nakagawai]
MKKKLLLPIYISISSFSLAQVGINQPNPNLSADLELGSTNKSLLLNRIPNTGVINSPVNGMLIYDVSEQCVKAFQGGAWSQCFWKESPFALVCASAVFNPSSATQNVAYSGTLTIPYTGGNGSAYAAQTFQSNGLTATLNAGNFATGNGSLQLNVLGTPVTTSPAVFSITVNGSTCSAISLPVNNGTPVVPSTITINEGIYFIGSVLDSDYSPYTEPTGPATTARPVAADGVPDKLADYQGFISTSGLDIFIPVTTTGSGSLTGWSSITTVPANLTEDGISRQLMLSWSTQSYDSNTRSIKAKLTAIGGTLNARKLDINAGIGNDYLGVLMARFQFPSNNSGTSKNYDVRILPGIPDRKFGETDNSGLREHNFLYLPVQAEDGYTWLNNNLGADYTNIDGTNFSIAQQATSAQDYKAYGSLFQWGRKPDGHELVKWTGPSSGTPVYPTVTSTANDNPTDTRFIGTGGGWRINNDPTLWQTSIKPNNPCPRGFTVPSKSQLDNYLLAAKLGSGINAAAASKLKLPAAGNRDSSFGTISSSYAGSSGFYWSGEAGGSSPSAYIFQVSQFGTHGVSSSGTAQGSSVRCIKE